MLVPLIVLLALYLGLAYLTHTTEHFYVYSFLNPANGRGLVAGACVGILVASIIVFVIVRYLILLRRWTTEQKLGLSEKGYPRPSPFGSPKVDGSVEMTPTSLGTINGHNV